MKFLSLAITGMQSSKLRDSGYQKKKKKKKKQFLIPWWLQDLLSLLQAKNKLSN